MKNIVLSVGDLFISKTHWGTVVGTIVDINDSPYRTYKIKIEWIASSKHGGEDNYKSVGYYKHPEIHAWLDPIDPEREVKHYPVLK